MIEPSVPGDPPPPPRDEAPRETDPVAPTVVPGEVVSEPGPDQARPFGRYRLVRELGRGAMGIVWKAWDTQLARAVALKMMRSDGEEDQDQIERFQREARLAAKIVHPNVVRVLDVGELEGQRYLTTEFVEAVSLDSLMEGPVPPAQALAWVKAIAEALAAAHELGVIHRDIKPGNVLVDRQEKPYVTDFGLAKEVPLGGIGTSAEKLTLSGVLLGTPSYMSPEQAQGEVSTLGPATDQFSLGVVMYELLTGQMPFEGEGLHELLSSIVDRDPVPLSKHRKAIHTDLEAICLKSLSKEPARRYASMRDMAADIQRHLDGESTRARPVSLFGRLVRSASRRRAVLLPVGGVVLVATLATIGVWQWRGEDVSREAEAKERAREAQARAEESIEKARLVSRVLQRWNGIHEAVMSMERAHFNSRLTPSEQRETAAAHWPAVETFMRETPDDKTSRATTRALAGWARSLALGEEEGIVWMREATVIDPEVPYGGLLEAIVWLLRYYQDDAGVRVETSGSTTVVAVEPDTAEDRAALAEVDRLLASIRAASVWGEGGAEGFAAVLEGIRAVRLGDFARAETEATRALGSAQVRAFESVLRLLRAKARFLQSNYGGTIEDLDEVIRAWPDHASPYCLRGIARQGAAEALNARREDPQPLFREALADYDAALERNMTPLMVHLNRGALWISLGKLELKGDGGGQDSFRRAIEDYDRAVEIAPDSAEYRRNRALAWLKLGQAEGYQRLDPIPPYRHAIDDLDFALSVDGADGKALELRGTCLCGIGQAEMAAAKDPSESFRRAIADLDAALVSRPGDPLVLGHRGFALLLRGSWEKGQGRDPAEDYRRGIADLEATLDALPREVETRRNRGAAWILVAENDAARGRDPRDPYRRAIQDFDALIADGDGPGENYYYRGMARRGLANSETGTDPREALSGAIEDLEVSLRKTPQNRQAWYGLTQARVDLAGAEQTRGGSPSVHVSRALADCERALGIDPGNWQVLAQRGYLRLATGDAEGALKDYAETSRLLGGTPDWLKGMIDEAEKKRKPR